MEQNRKRDIFYGVVAVATLIVALVGATLAYFSITVNSDEGAVNAGSKVVEISYEDSKGVIAQADELIPADFETVVKKAYLNAQGSLSGEGAIASNLCVDKPGKDEMNNEIPGRQVCSIYRFTIGNNGGTDFNIVAALNSELNTFVGGDIKYALYDVENSSWVILDGVNESLGMSYCNNTEDSDEKKCFIEKTEGTKTVKEYVNEGDSRATNYLFDEEHSITIPKGDKRTYDLVIFLNEKNIPQDENQGKQFSGTIRIELAGNSLDTYIGGKITGKYEE